MPTATRKRSAGLPFKRLSKAAKERAIENAIEWSHIDFDADWLTDCMNEELHEHHGFPDLNVSGWALSYCQGDGVDIDGSIDIGELAKTDEFVLTCLAKGVLLGVCDLDDWDFVCKVKNSRLEFEWQMYNSGEFASVRGAVDAIALELHEHLKSIVADLKRSLERYGYDEIEYQTSEEHAIDTIEANDWRFDREGNKL